MAKTYTAIATAVACGNGKSMLAIANTHATRKVKVWRVWLYPNTTAVTGVLADFILRRFTTMSAGTTVTPVAHDTGNVSIDLTSVTVSTGATITSPTQFAGHAFLSTEEPVLSGAVSQNLLTMYPFAEIWNSGVGDSNIQPITLRQNEGFDILCNTNTTAGNFDVIIEFTVEA